MWIPKTEQEISDVVASGILEETPIFDAKREFPKNQEIAKDIAAMANDGGVIIFGLDEDENKRITILNPIPIAGQRERIDSIVRSSISEPPMISIYSIPTKEDPSVGYIVVQIPLSDRAPHMVVVNGDHRYYGRSATGNTILTEGEVARLYTRRELVKIDLDKMIMEEISKSILQPHKNYVYLYLFARPKFAREGFFSEINGDVAKFKLKLVEKINQACSPEIWKRDLFTPDFRAPRAWRQSPEGLLGQMGWEMSDPQKIPESTLNIKVDFKGVCHLFCGRGGAKINEETGVQVFIEIITGLTLRFISFISGLYSEIHYSGMVDMGIALTGLMGSVVYTKDWQLEYSRLPYEQNEYLRIASFSMMILDQNPKEIGKRLLMPFIDTLTQGAVNPFL